MTFVSPIHDTLELFAYWTSVHRASEQRVRLLCMRPELDEGSVTTAPLAAVSAGDDVEAVRRVTGGGPQPVLGELGGEPLGVKTYQRSATVTSVSCRSASTTR